MNLYQMLRYDEGEKLELYLDTEGYWTIGIGHLVTKNPLKAEAIRILGSDKITKEQSEKMFNEDVQDALRAIKNSTLNRTYQSLDKVRQDALVNMVFQLGLKGVQNFKNMIKALDAKNFALAAKEALDSRWARQTPKRAYRVSEVLRTGTTSSY